MTLQELKKLSKSFLVLTLALWLPGCKTKQNGSHDQLSANSEETLAAPEALALLEQNPASQRPLVHAIRLDSAEFRVVGLRVGEQDYLRFSTPVLVFDLPALADYVEILRCPAEVMINGGADNLDVVELGAKDLASETRIFQRNNFWEAAVATSGCLQLTTSYTDTSFIDSVSPSGTFHYYVRACVDAGRLTATATFSTGACSRQVSRSAAHTHVNRRGAAQLQALAEANTTRSKIDSLHRQIVAKTLTLNEQLFSCQQKHQKKVASTSKKAALAHILAASTAVGVPILAYAASKQLGAAVTSTGVASTLSFAAAAALVVDSVTKATASPSQGYPQDAKGCYQQAEEGTKTAHFSQDCSCVAALRSQADLEVLGKSLQQQLLLQQRYLDAAQKQANVTP